MLIVKVSCGMLIKLVELLLVFGGTGLLSHRMVMISMVVGLLLFFSSRRRHTRFDCDWSSDVCSSDLPRGAPHRPRRARAQGGGVDRRSGADRSRIVERGGGRARGRPAPRRGRRGAPPRAEIGRASCRGRV